VHRICLLLTQSGHWLCSAKSECRRPDHGGSSALRARSGTPCYLPHFDFMRAAATRPLKISGLSRRAFDIAITIRRLCRTVQAAILVSVTTPIIGFEARTAAAAASWVGWIGNPARNRIYFPTDALTNALWVSFENRAVGETTSGARCLSCIRTVLLGHAYRWMWPDLLAPAVC